ncbi:MAG: hypothetical protein HONBIEJF_01239 [Fimbriimonadaceae bacterium]|nr:hypothetical protein [Fimbriimonadaceae bacterium]
MRFQITKCWTLLGLLSASAWAVSQGKLDGVETHANSKGVQVDIRGENLGKPKELRVNGGNSYLLEFNATMVGRGQRNGVNKAGVEFVQYAWFKAKPPTIRVHVRMKPDVEPVLSKTDEGWKVVIGSAEDEEKSKQKPNIASINSEPKNPVKIEPPFLPYPKGSDSSAKTTHRPVETPARTETDTQTKGVTLDFVNTDVIQILKALSIQAGVNIVASPDVSPADKPLRLTISLHKVTVDEALSFVTALSKLRFGRVGNTFVVSLSENFGAAMRQIMDRDSERFTTKVVALKSGEGIQIRQAVVKALPPEGRGGWYDLIVPGYTPTGTSPSSGKGGSAPAELGGGASIHDALNNALGGGGQGLPAGAGGPQTKTEEPKASPGTEVLSTGGLRERAFYLMIVGEPKRIDAISKYVEDLDARIIESFCLAMTTDMGTLVVPVNSGRPEQITAMLQRILSSNPRAHEYSFNTTTVKDLQEGEESTHILLVMGPTAEIKRLEEMIITMDNEMCLAAGITIARTPEERERVYAVIDLKYAEPKMAEFDLKSKIRGLQVSVLPDPVTPGLRGKLKDTKLDDPQDPAAKAPSKVDEETIKKGVGREPMRLVVRGTREQIQKAKDYIALVDVPARQVALELRVMDLSKEDALKSGIDWSIFTGGAVKIIRLNNALTGASNTGNASLGGYGSVTAMLDSITNNTNLIARPNTMAIDGMPSTIFIGDVIRYVESITASQNGVTVKTAALEVGVKLSVLPRIGSDGTITMVVNPLVSFLKSFTPVPGGGQLPQTSDRSAMNTLSIKSGETIAIGGLIQHQDTMNVSGIPILKDLPLIGRLFSKTENIRNKKEVVIFLTARVIEGAATSETAPPIDKNMPKNGKGDK